MRKLNLKESTTINGGDFIARLQKQDFKCRTSGNCARYNRMIARNNAY